MRQLLGADHIQLATVLHLDTEVLSGRPTATRRRTGGGRVGELLSRMAALGVTRLPISPELLRAAGKIWSARCLRGWTVERDRDQRAVEVGDMEVIDGPLLALCSRVSNRQIWAVVLGGSVGVTLAHRWLADQGSLMPQRSLFWSWPAPPALVLIGVAVLLFTRSARSGRGRAGR